MKLCVSDRCFFPWGTWQSSRTIVSLAKDLGYQRVELHPTWGICKEYLLHKRLLCSVKDICSWHIDWRQDRKYDKAPFYKKITHQSSQLFPLSGLAVNTLQKLEKQYQRPVVIHWPENITQYQHPILELHRQLSLGPKQLEKLLANKSIKGLVIDTAKFDGWIKYHQLTKEKTQIIRRFRKYICEIHLRIKSKADLNSFFTSRKSRSISLAEHLIKNKIGDRVVVEAGWPDAGQVSNLWRLDRKKTIDIHNNITRFIKKHIHL